MHDEAVTTVVELNVTAAQGFSHAGIMLKRVGEAADFQHRLSQRLALLSCEQLGELLFVLQEEMCGFRKTLTALGWGKLTP